MELEFNHRYTLQTPQGTISDRGIELIRIYLSNQHPSQDQNWIEANNGAVTLPNQLPLLPESWEWVWLVTGKAQYVGTFPKRISKYYYTAHSYKVPKSVMSELGNIARTHSAEEVTYNFDFVKNFDWNAGDFGDGGSCFWGGRSLARKMIKDADGFAIRFFNDDKGIARAWIIPEDDMYFLFNGYGFQTVKIARIFATFMEMSYKKIWLSNSNAITATLYINGGVGYVVSDYATIETVKSHDFGIYDEEIVECSACGEYVDHDDLYIGLDDEPYCYDCFHDRFRDCDECGRTEYSDETYYIEGEEIEVCESCYERHFDRCEICGEIFRQGEMTVVDDIIYCPNCTPEEYESEE